MPRILVVEDDRAIAMALEDDLTLDGHEVEVVRDGEGALRRAREKPFDLILLDVMLPRVDGFEVCRHLRRTESRAAIIMLTAKTQLAEKVLGLELGADDYITKPFDPMELRARIKAVLRRASGELPEISRFDDVEVDTARCEARRAGRPLELTALEFRLLAAFLRHRGKAISRDRLLSEVWGTEVYLTDRVVDNHIANLRKKIEPDPAHPRYLVSVRGVGYRFDG
jgi:DNA-binding response OmpR family regulator